jgi:predicted mannosyl-3-phosphoglycerate phosphatase (HAD superfamily)
LPFVKFAVAVTGIHVETMHELSPQTVAEISQYTLDDAKNALTRQYSVAISLRSFRDGDISLFLDSLRYFQCSVSTGGHWMIVTRDTDKGLAADWYRGWLRRNNYNYSIIAGIGNDNNDAPMLRTVDMPFVIRNSSGYAESLASLPSAYLLQSEGTMGWIEMINVLDESTYSSHFTKKHSKKGLA